MYRRMRFPGFKVKALTLSYDDAVEQDIRLIDIMQKNGLKGTFNVNTGLFAPEGHTYPEGQIHRRMSKKAAYDLYMNSGMEVAVHAYYHPHLEVLSEAEITYEVLRDKTDIENTTGRITRGMAYPYGSTDDTVVDCLKSCGILYARTTVATNNFNIPSDWLRLPATCHHKHPDLMGLAKKFVELNPVQEPLLFYLWGHSYEFDMDNNWHVIEEFAEFMGNRDEIWYATNSEIFEYIEEYKKLLTSADGTLVYNPTSTALFFHVHGTDYRLAPGETVKIDFQYRK